MQVDLPKTKIAKLDTLLHILQAAINANAPLRSDTILIDETPSGSIISIAPPNTDSSQPSSGSSSSGSTDNDSAEDNAIAALQTQVATLIAEVTLLNNLLSGVTTQQITVINPGANCAQSTVTFLVKQ